MTDEQIKTAILKCRENIRAGDVWAPDYAKFVSIANGIDGLDYEQAFDRMIRKKPDGDVEYWADHEVGFKCRTQLAEEAAKTLHRKTLDKYTKRMNDGSLPDRNIKMIAKHSTKGNAHILMEQNETEESRAIAQRILNRVKGAKGNG
ncbi:hypothetical protein [Vibrio phage vB_VpM-pA2SJ1]|uniref:Uncharacterized protein n=1 Tax=Vibrio phage vB_VpM-pA2SJ1 TaxID=3095964 RepID=A0AAX4J574_9CAUD